MAILEEILEDIRVERIRQDDKWGPIPRYKHPLYYVGVLAEELGEYTTDVNDEKWEEGKYLENMRKELVQIAASAVVAIQDLDAQFETQDKW